MSDNPRRDIAFRESKAEKQPHGDRVRLFEYITPSDKMRLEALLFGKAPKDAELILESGGTVKISEYQTEEGRYAVRAADVLERLCAHMAKAFPDMELSFTNVNCTDELIDIHISNLMRICMLCADMAGSYSLDRCLDICLKSRVHTVQAELRFETDALHDLRDDVRVDLARFVSEAEKCFFDMTVSEGAVTFIFAASYEPDDMPEFKFIDQFEGWDDYFGSVSADVRALNA